MAVWADDLDIPGLADRYRVPKWQLRSIIRRAPPGGGDPEYALQPMPMTFATLRGNTTISKFLAGSSAFYVELDAAGDTQALQLELDATTQAGLAILRYE